MNRFGSISVPNILWKGNKLTSFGRDGKTASRNILHMLHENLEDLAWLSKTTLYTDWLGMYVPGRWNPLSVI